ncbi:hypothetical protein C8Q80DRAFT_873247 [Daedaleopsis nitida]|nr:hypothetical protein C8Q80DRAFT_873247 [Daedaleopsis nitida]
MRRRWPWVRRACVALQRKRKGQETYMTCRARTATGSNPRPTSQVRRPLARTAPPPHSECLSSVALWWQLVARRDASNRDGYRRRCQWGLARRRTQKRNV